MSQKRFFCQKKLIFGYSTTRRNTFEEILMGQPIRVNIFFETPDAGIPNYRKARMLLFSLFCPLLSFYFVSFFIAYPFLQCFSHNSTKLHLTFPLYFALQHFKANPLCPSFSFWNSTEPSFHLFSIKGKSYFFPLNSAHSIFSVKGQKSDQPQSPAAGLWGKW